MPRALVLPSLPHGPASRAALAAAVRAALLAGSLCPGELLPSLRDLAAQSGLHWHTVRAALLELESEGWLAAEPRRGYRALAPPDGAPPAWNRGAGAKGRGGGLEAERGPQPCGQGRAAAVARDFGPAAPEPGPFTSDLRWGHADLRSFPLAEFRGHWRGALRRLKPELLGYGDPRGHGPYLAQLADYLRRRRGLLGRELLATQGSQEALHLVAQVLLRSGDRVAVERLAYGGALEVFRAADAVVDRLDQDEEGLVPESLERLLRRGRTRLLYLTPLHQYPTTTGLGAPRRRRIYELLRRHGVLLLEDDYDHEVHYRGQPQEPMAAHDPAGIVVYVSSFSKVLLPSLRLGFLALPPGLGPAFASARRVISRQGDTLVQEAMGRWMAEDGFERHLRRVRRISLDRLDFFERGLHGLRRKGLRLDWRRPDGGLALWLDLGQDSARAAARAARLGLGILPESQFSEGGNGQHARLGFARINHSEQQRALELLGRSLAKPGS